MTATLKGGEWSAGRPGRTLLPGKTHYSFCRRLGGPQGQSGRVENLVSTGIRSVTVQPVAQSLYRLNYPAHCNFKLVHKICASNLVRIKFHKFYLMTFSMPITRDCGLVCSNTEIEGSASLRLCWRSPIFMWCWPIHEGDTRLTAGRPSNSGEYRRGIGFKNVSGSERPAT